jgi:hypothetical protein
MVKKRQKKSWPILEVEKRLKKTSFYVTNITMIKKKELRIRISTAEKKIIDPGKRGLICRRYLCFMG